MIKQTGKILIAGGSGQIGSVLKEELTRKNKTVHVLSRSESPDQHVHRWDPDTGFIDEKIRGHQFDVLINLSGAGIADKRWTSARKKVLYDSRIIPTRFLWSLIKDGRINTNKFIQISASGFYGNRSEPVNENDPSGPADDFMVQLVKGWEEAFLSYATDDIPHCRARLGVVISSRGGFIDPFLMPVRFFISPYFGNGQNYISWVHDSDLAEMIYILIEKEELDPVYNISTPLPFTSKQFSKKLKKVFNPFAIPFPVPAWVIKTLYGELESAIISDVKMMPGLFQDMSYNFHFTDIEDALKRVKKDR